MKNYNVEVLFVIDASGSMSKLADDTIGGFNGFIDRQKRMDGKAKVTTTLFNSKATVLYSGVDISEVEKLTEETYQTGGMTALLDAVGETISTTQDRIDETPIEERMDKVIVVIITDGQENVSRKYTKDQIKKMVEHQTKGHGWEFVFLGANIDSFAESSGIGVTKSMDFAFTNEGLTTAYAAVDSAVSSLRSTGSVSAEWTNADVLSNVIETHDSITSLSCDGK